MTREALIAMLESAEESRPLKEWENDPAYQNRGPSPARTSPEQVASWRRTIQAMPSHTFEEFASAVLGFFGSKLGVLG